MEITINTKNLNINDIQERETKVRALLITEDKILVAQYGNVLLLPGGKLDKYESIEDALSREIYEELGMEYSFDSTNYLATINHFQKDYPKLNGKTLNRLITTHFYVSEFIGMDLNNQKLSEREIKGNFKLMLVPIYTLEKMVLYNINTNPRNKFFKNELLTILEYYKHLQENTIEKHR